MPMVHFIGEIKICKVAGNELFFQKSISLTWAIVAGMHKLNYGITYMMAEVIKNYLKSYCQF
jgi:hypothetical protein